MPVPEAQAVALAFRKRLLALDSATLRQLIAAYGPIWQSVEGQVEAILAGKDQTDAQRLERLKALQAQIELKVS